MGSTSPPSCSTVSQKLECGKFASSGIELGRRGNYLDEIATAHYSNHSATLNDQRFARAVTRRRATDYVLSRRSGGRPRSVSVGQAPRRLRVRSHVRVNSTGASSLHIANEFASTAVNMGSICGYRRTTKRRQNATFHVTAADSRRPVPSGCGVGLSHRLPVSYAAEPRTREVSGTAPDSWRPRPHR